MQIVGQLIISGHYTRLFHIDLINQHSPWMSFATILNVGQFIFQLLEQGIVLLHCWNGNVFAQVLNTIHRAYNTGRSTTE